MEIKVKNSITVSNELQSSTNMTREAITLSRNALYILTSCEFDEQTHILLLEQYERKCIVRAFKAFSTLLLALSENDIMERTTICARNLQAGKMQLPHLNKLIPDPTVWPFSEQKLLISSEDNNDVSVKANINSFVRDRVYDYISIMKEQIKKRHTEVSVSKCTNRENHKEEHYNKMESEITYNWAKDMDAHVSKQHNYDHYHKKQPETEEHNIDFSFLWSEDNNKHTDSNTINSDSNTDANNEVSTQICECVVVKFNSTIKDSLYNNVSSKLEAKAKNEMNENTHSRMSQSKKAQMEESMNNNIIEKELNDVLPDKNEQLTHRARPSRSLLHSPERMSHVDHHTITDRWASQLQFDRF